MTPLQMYMRAMRPVILPYCDAMDAYAAFIRDVGAGEYGGLRPWLPTKQNKTPPQDVVDLYPEAPEAKKDAAATVARKVYRDAPVGAPPAPQTAETEQATPSPAPSFLDPFASWAALAALMPAAPSAPEPQRPPLYAAPNPEPEARPSSAKEKLAELARQAEGVRVELERVQAEQRRLAERAPAPMAFNPMDGWQAFSDMVATMADVIITPQTPNARVGDGGLIEGRAITDPTPQPNRPDESDETNGHISHAAAHKRAKKAWRTRRAKLDAAEEAKAKRRKKRARKDH